MYNIPCTAEIGWMDESLCSNSSKSGSIIHFYAILIQMIQCSLTVISQINKFQTRDYFNADYVLPFKKINMVY